MTKEEKKHQAVPQKRSGFYLRGTLLIAITVLIVTLFTGGIAYGIQSMVTEAREGVLLENGVREFRMSVQQWYYVTAVIRVSPGDTVRFIIESKDITHGFAINELGINRTIYADTKVMQEVVIPPDMPEDTYTMYCSVFCGMGHPILKGKIIVGYPRLFLGVGMDKILPYLATSVMAGMFARFIIKEGIMGRRRTI